MPEDASVLGTKRRTVFTCLSNM